MIMPKIPPFIGFCLRHLPANGRKTAVIACKLVYANFKKFNHANSENSPGRIRLLHSGDNVDVIARHKNIGPGKHKLFAGSVSEQHYGDLLHQHPGVLHADGDGP